MSTALGFVALRSQFTDSMRICLEASKGRKELEMSPIQASFAAASEVTSETERKTAMDQVGLDYLFIDYVDILSTAL